jgi:hypothetical protein
MRVVAIAITLILSVAATAAAQEWDEFVSKEDGFKVDFPARRRSLMSPGSRSLTTFFQARSTASTRERNAIR